MRASGTLTGDADDADRATQLAADAAAARAEAAKKVKTDKKAAKAAVFSGDGPFRASGVRRAGSKTRQDGTKSGKVALKLQPPPLAGVEAKEIVVFVKPIYVAEALKVLLKTVVGVEYASVAMATEAVGVAVLPFRNDRPSQKALKAHTTKAGRARNCFLGIRDKEIREEVMRKGYATIEGKLDAKHVAVLLGVAKRETGKKSAQQFKVANGQWCLVYLSVRGVGSAAAVAPTECTLVEIKKNDEIEALQAARDLVATYVDAVGSKFPAVMLAGAETQRMHRDCLEPIVAAIFLLVDGLTTEFVEYAGLDYTC
ncbi:hypothetical protein M885DRAFT_564352 [Pelagophyceae sp. CCMP2097]|nr:hypothetical protein M885DRAFT_564352 [Pelagophyceae sp. CCMP2097]